MKRLVIGILLAALLLTCFAECSRTEENVPDQSPIMEEAAAPEPMPAETPLAEETPEPEEAPVVEETVLRHPLTGEVVEEDVSMYRPFAVMINNISVAQPQVGISRADMIFELMDEGGITRMMAFFTDLDSVEKVGSIRSARIYNISVIDAFDGIIVRAGGSSEADAYVSANGVNDVDYVAGRYSSDTFYRDPSRQSHGIEHSLFGVGTGILRSAENLGYRFEHNEGYDGTYGLTFREDADDQGTGDANYIYITYAGGKYMNFTYNADTGLYTGEQYGSVYADNGEIPVEFRNVIVLNANTYLQSDGIHLTIDLVGSGNGYFCCGGRYVPIQWTRGSESDTFHYSLMDGTPLALGVGKTFVAVQQVGSYAGSTSFSA